MSDSRVRPPRLVLVTGATGVGKSTLAHRTAAELGFARFASTDSVREVLRMSANPAEQPALHRSSYSHGETGDAVNDWIDACAVVEAGIVAVIGRARGEGVDLIVEGVHIIPQNRWLREWTASGGIAIGVCATVETEARHLEFIEARESRTHRSVDRYIQSFGRIRAVQDAVIERGRISGWLQVDGIFHRDPVERIRQTLDEAWYEHQRSII